MEIKNFCITKRDGSKDRFSLDKIMNAIIKAFESVGQPVDLGSISKILSHLDIKNDIKVTALPSLSCFTVSSIQRIERHLNG